MATGDDWRTWDMSKLPATVNVAGLTYSVIPNDD